MKCLHDTGGGGAIGSVGKGGTNREHWWSAFMTLGEGGQ